MPRFVLRDEETLVSIIVILTAFLWINVNPQLGAFYTVATLFYFMPLIAKRKDFFVEIMTASQKIIKGVFIALAVLGIFLIASTTVLKFTGTEVAMSDFFTHLNAQTQIPILSQNPSIRLATYGVAIPIIESLFFLSFVLTLAARAFRLRIQWHKFGTPSFWKMIIVCAVVGATGSLFHMTVRLMADTALLVDFIFFAGSALLVFKFRQLFEPILFHILVNSGVLILGGGG